MLRTFFCIGFLVSTVLSHPKGNAKIDMHIFPDSLVMKLNVNKDDILYYSEMGNENWWQMTEEDVFETNRRLERYLKEWLIIEFDRERATDMHKLAWSSDSSDPAKDMDTSDFAQNNLDMALSWPRPSGASEMRFSSQIYFSFPFEPLAIVKVFWRSVTVKEAYLTLDDDLFIKLHPDSLDAMVQRIREANKPKKPVWHTVVIITLPAVFLCALALVIIWRIRFKPRKSH